MRQRRTIDESPMHYAIQHQVKSYDYLQTTARKKVLKHSLIRVESGLLLARLGKKEYAVEPGQYIWIPFDCLCALSFFPQSVIQRIDLSCRLKENFPQNAGYVAESKLIGAIFERLTQTLPAEFKQHLLQSVRYEILGTNPALKLTPLSEQITDWKPNNQCTLAKSHQLVLTVREAQKRRLSGVKQQLIVDDLFHGKADDFKMLNELILGTDKN